MDHCLKPSCGHDLADDHIFLPTVGSDDMLWAVCTVCTKENPIDFEVLKWETRACGVQTWEEVAKLIGADNIEADPLTGPWMVKE